MPSELRQLAIAALDRALAGEDAERALARTLRARPLPNEDRARLAKWVLGASCLRARLRHVVEQRGEQLTTASLLDALDDDRPVDWPTDPQRRLEAECSLPSWLAELWLNELGFESARSLALAMNQPGPITLRARDDRDALAKVLLQEGIATKAAKLAPHALHVVGRGNLWGSSAWRAGLFEVQDEASQLVIEACAAKPGERWLDLCAGAGGKTLGLAATGAQVVAHDIDESRLTNLSARVKRAGARNVEIVRELGDQKFDGVLVDAPCSELGTLRRHPDARWRIDPAVLSSMPVLQRELLERARALGARVVYATCTIHRAENEEIAGPGQTLRPDVEGTDGFFIARG